MMLQLYRKIPIVLLWTWVQGRGQQEMAGEETSGRNFLFQSQQRRSCRGDIAGETLQGDELVTLQDIAEGGEMLHSEKCCRGVLQVETMQWEMMHCETRLLFWQTATLCCETLWGKKLQADLMGEMLQGRQCGEKVMLQ